MTYFIRRVINAGEPSQIYTSHQHHPLVAVTCITTQCLRSAPPVSAPELRQWAVQCLALLALEAPAYLLLDCGLAGRVNDGAVSVQGQHAPAFLLARNLHRIVSEDQHSGTCNQHTAFRHLTLGYIWVRLSVTNNDVTLIHVIQLRQCIPFQVVLNTQMSCSESILQRLADG